MGADRARISHDPTRQYREVVWQQGRVTLEADWNEAQHIGSEEVRHHARDFVGPCGTPDDGYRVMPKGDHVGIKHGTMYVAGLRLRLEQDVSFAEQPEWLDRAVDPLGAQLLPGETPKATHERIVWPPYAYVVLHCREQEISAVEDPALRDVALGGPDTAARTRILQRVILASTRFGTCAEAAKEIDEFWLRHGLLRAPASASLESCARLHVSLPEVKAGAKVCDPPAQSGYLGADNQLIRVQVTEFGVKSRQGKLLWGYNNASMLHRCRVLNKTALELIEPPVSPEHTLRTGQAVQVLLPTAKLGDDAFAAALSGQVVKLTAPGPYNPDTKELTLPAALTGPYLATDNRRPLFVRLWEDELDFELGKPLELPGTGLAVTLTKADEAAERLPIGDYWCFAARPETPDVVYPGRFLHDPQLPDGPRQWTCPLAVLHRGKKGWEPRDNCRRHFDNLVELTGRECASCCVTVGPKDAGRLQAIINNLDLGGGMMRAKVRFLPGCYELPVPLVIGKQHHGLVLEGCADARIVPAVLAESLELFALGTIQLQNVDSLTLRGLTFDLSVPQVRGEEGRPKAEVSKPTMTHATTTSRIPIGIHIDGGQSVTIEQCVFDFGASPPQSGVGVLGRGDLVRLTLLRCRVTASAAGEGTSTLGLLIAPPKGALPPVVQDLTLYGNTFEGLACGVALAASLGTVNVHSNVMRGCRTSFDLHASSADFGEILARLRAWPTIERDSGGERTKAFLKNVPTSHPLCDTLELAGSLPTLAEATYIGQSRPPATEDKTTRRAARAEATSALAAGRAGASIPIARATIARASGIHLSLSLCANHFDSRPSSTSMGKWSWAVLVECDDPLDTANITGNAFWLRSSRGATLGVNSVGRFNVTGNVVVNEGSGPGKTGFALLVLRGTAAVPRKKDMRPAKFTPLPFTVTGNTLVGGSNLCDWVRHEWSGKGVDQVLTWEFFNANV